MGALFSLPIISLLLVPTMTSYATSLNFIFFYMTWSTLVLSHSPLRVELVSSAAVRVLFFVLPSILFFLFDILTPSAAVLVKAQGEAGLPSGRKKRNVRTRELKVVAWSLFNVLLGTILQAAVETLLVQGLAIRSAVKVSMRLPMPWEMGKGLILGLLIREVSIIPCEILLRQNNLLTTDNLSGSLGLDLLCSPLCLAQLEIGLH